MKKLFASLFVSLLSVLALAQQLDWNVNMDYVLFNYEYDRSNNLYDESYTLHAARITPELGVLVKQNGGLYHRAMAGIDVFREMGSGEPILNSFKQLLFYYELEAALPSGGRLEAIAGIFPRHFSEGVYIGPFFDDDVLFLDNNLEGFFFKYRNDRFYAEAGLDWPEMTSEANPEMRERFQLLTSGLWNFAGNFNLGWAGSFYHFSTALMYPNVVDNHMFNPWVEWNPKSFFDEVKVGAGMLITYQCNRKVSKIPSFPMGFYSQQMLSKWHLTIDNHFYYGDDLMPFYESSYNGKMYGANLYYGDCAFHTRMDHASWTDFLTLSFTPEFSDFFDLSVAVSFHFGEPSEALGSPLFRGCQQSIALNLNLDAIRQHPSRRGGHRRHMSREFIL